MAEQRPPVRPALNPARLLHPRERDQFTARCIDTAPDEFPGLRLRVTGHLARIEESATDASLTDIDTARQVATVLGQLLDEPDLFDAECRALIRGAVEYFVLTGDGQDDVDDIVGFDDDARITNAVLEALGRADLHITPGAGPL
jgi:hypothetical protein